MDQRVLALGMGMLVLGGFGLALFLLAPSAQAPQRGTEAPSVSEASRRAPALPGSGPAQRPSAPAAVARGEQTPQELAAADKVKVLNAEAGPDKPPPVPRVPPPVLPQGIEDDILALLAEDLGVEAARDLFEEGPAVNIYQDNGGGTPNRVKIDHDRDGQYDERWEIKKGVVLRRVALDDDENYNQAWVRKNGEWRASRKHPGLR